MLCRFNDLRGFNMTDKKRYSYCKKNGICVMCHKEKATHGVRCERCYIKHKTYNKAYEKQRYEWEKAKGYCTACHKEKSVNGTNYCLVCLMDKRERVKPLSEDKKSQKRKYAISRYYDHKEKGICVQCAKRPASKGSVFCQYCKDKKKNKEYNKRREMGITPNFMRGNGDYCALCRKPVENKGSKLCNKCLENSLKTIKLAQAKRPEDNWFAKQNRAFWAKRNARKKSIGGKI